MRLRPILVIICFLFVGLTPSAYSSERLKPYSDAWVRARVDALVMAAHAAYENDEALPAYERVLKSIAKTIRRRRLSQNESFVSRYREFVEYIQTVTLDQQPGHELGFLVPDKQYFEQTQQFVQIPEFLLSQGFLRVVSRYKTLDQAKSFLRLLNSIRGPDDQLLFFSYNSRHLGTPDSENSYGRLLVVVPGNAEMGIPEKWVQFGVPDPGARSRVRNVSVISAMVNSDGTFNTYFKDFFRTYRRDGSISIKGRWELGYGDDNCALCHKSGVLPIFPVEGSVRPEEQPAVLAINRRFLTYGSPRFDKYLDESKFGPGLSSAGLKQRTQRFGAGFGQTVVGQAMSCATCHQPLRLGALNWPMDKTIITSYIQGGQMPLGNSLEITEREQLHKRLIQEYFATSNTNPGILKSWLMGKVR